LGGGLGDDASAPVTDVAERVDYGHRADLPRSIGLESAAEATFHGARRPGDLTDGCPRSRTDRAFGEVVRHRDIARVIRHRRRWPGVESAQWREVEDHRRGNDRYDTARYGEAAAALFHPAHHAGGGIESVRRPAGEHHGVDAID